MLFDGSWVEGVQDGPGFIRRPDGLIFVGQFENGEAVDGMCARVEPGDDKIHLVTNNHISHSFHFKDV